MSDYYFTIAVGNRCALCISPLTNDELASEGDISGDGRGYYLYERDDSADSLTILAEISSEDAAVQLYRLLALMKRSQSLAA